MKRLLLGVTISVLALGSAAANRPEVELKSQKDNADYEYVTVTGSHLKQAVRKRNIITTTREGTVLTIDQEEMKRNGNGQLSDQLRHYPGVQISGGR
jgi:outer membrane receptor for Fe3+-dicitrate